MAGRSEARWPPRSSKRSVLKPALGAAISIDLPRSPRSSSKRALLKPALVVVEALVDAHDDAHDDAQDGAHDGARDEALVDATGAAAAAGHVACAHDDAHARACSSSSRLGVVGGKGTIGMEQSEPVQPAAHMQKPRTHSPLSEHWLTQKERTTISHIRPPRSS